MFSGLNMDLLSSSMISVPCFSLEQLIAKLPVVLFSPEQVAEHAWLMPQESPWQWDQNTTTQLQSS